MITECSKLRASRAFVPNVPHLPTCFTCSCTLRACVPSCLCFLRACLFYVPCVPSCFYLPYMPPVFYMPYVPSFFNCLTCPHFLLALRAFIILRTFISFVFYVFSFFTCLHFIYVCANKTHTN